MTQQEKAKHFASLHKAGEPLVLFNVWDAASAAVCAKAGAQAIATGSHSVAGALGYDDGEACPLDTILFVLSRICAVTSLPVTHDLERGFGNSAAEVAESCGRALEIGAIGLNIEDSLESGELRSIDEQCERLTAARAAMERSVPGSFLNARCDVFFQKADNEIGGQIDGAIVRATKYADCGASGIFIPGLSDVDAITAFCKRSPLPVNIMRALHGPTTTDLRKTGVSRISHGPFPFIDTMAKVEAMARLVHS